METFRGDLFAKPHFEIHEYLLRHNRHTLSYFSSVQSYSIINNKNFVI